jgi:hypothetical protein
MMRVLRMMSLLLLMGRRLSLASFHEINAEGVRDHTEGGKSDVRCNNINVTYGYAKQGFQSQANEDTFDLKEYQKQATDWEVVLGVVEFCC